MACRKKKISHVMVDGSAQEVAKEASGDAGPAEREIHTLASSIGP
jgi:hypothetical protein